MGHKLLNEWPVFKRFQVEKIYNKFSKEEKAFLEEYLQLRRARGCSTERKISDIRRHMIQIIYALGEDYSKLGLPINKKENVPLKVFRNLIALINSAKLSKIVKNDMKCDFKLLLKMKYPDWSARFSEFDDVKLDYSRNEERINAKNIFKKEDIEKLMKHETKMYWKAFLMTQYEAGLRTIEARLLKWDDMKLNVDGDLSEVSIFATKTKKARTIFVKEATFYLQKLKEQQENLGQKGIYVFHSIKDKNEPICKANVNVWFKTLSQKALGRVGWPYLLRHSRATELYKLAKENKIAKDTAIDFMGHSEDMSNVYTHLDNNKLKEMLKNQVYKLEDLPPETKAELEMEIDELKKQMKDMEDFQKDAPNIILNLLKKKPGLLAEALKRKN